MLDLRLQLTVGLTAFLLLPARYGLFQEDKNTIRVSQSDTTSLQQTTLSEKQNHISWDWSPDYKSFNLRTSGSSLVNLKGIGGSIAINGKTYFLQDAKVVSKPAETQVDDNEITRIEYSFPGINCLWIWELGYRNDKLVIQTAVKNTGKIPLSIGKWDVVNLSGKRNGNFLFGNTLNDARFFRWIAWNMRVEMLNSAGGLHSSDNLCLLFDPGIKQSFLSAFTTMDKMHCYHNITYSPLNGIEEYKATCSFGQYTLHPRQTLSAEELSITFYNNPYQALEDWADYIHESKKTVFPKLAHTGLSSGAWRQLYTGDGTRPDYAKFSLENAKGLRNKLKGFDIDIYRVNTLAALKDGIPGNWTKADERFFTYTKGYENFLRELQKLGFKPGVWNAPFWFCSEADNVLKENNKNLLRDCKGTPVTQTLNWSGDVSDTSYMSKLHQYYLDGTHPATKAYIKNVFAYNKKLGIRFYMLDFLQVPGNSCLYDPSQTPLQAAGNILKIIRETAGKDTHLQTAVSSTPAYSGLIDAARVGRDFGEGRPLEGAPISDWGNATYVLHDLNYSNTHYLLQNCAASYFTHRKLYINDLNLLTIDKPIPLEQARIVTTIFGLSGSPLMLGDDYHSINEERLKMVKLCLPRTQGWPIPVDLFDHVYPNDYSRFLKLPVKTGWGEYELVAVFNHDDTSYNAKLDFNTLGLHSNKSYRVYEFWNEEYFGTYREGFDYIIPPNSCRLFRIAEVREHPWLLSTDMHIQQGAVEVEELNWDEKRRCLSGRVTRPVGEVGNLYFIMPRKMRVLNSEGLWLMKELNDMNVIIRKEITFTKEHESFEIFFEPWERKYVPEHLMRHGTEEEWMESLQLPKNSVF